MERNFLISTLAGGGFLGYCLTMSPVTLAQISPDATLGSENSVLTPNVLINGGLADRVDGGALRGSALFHSFQDFSVMDGQRVYFANPVGIEHIFSRVTGVNPSNIFGTLGVDGLANLYLINPNGISFGPDAQVDVRSSFVGSTQDSIYFENAYTFSAINPDAPPLLTVNFNPGLNAWLPKSGSLTSQASLSTGQNLTLAGNVLALQGELRAGGDLTLLASDTLLAQDSLLQPFIASAGGDLLLQGNQGLEVVALAHSNSGLFSASDTVLRSDNPILGDAHFFSGGSFRVEQLDGSSGTFTSPNDPVVRAGGDVSFDSYTGASLHILAGGSITAGDITITGPDTTGNALQQQVTLSDGVTVVNIDGTTQPTLDLRAGTLDFGVPSIADDTTGFTPADPNTGSAATSANITLTSVSNPGGLVFLTNQYAPNPALAGNILVNSIDTVDFDGGGDVIIDSKGDLTATFVNASGGDVFEFLNSFDPALFNGNGGAITFRADGAINLPTASEVYTYGLQSGAITLSSNTSINQGPASFLEGSTVATGGVGGTYRLEAPVISLSGSNAIYQDVYDPVGGIGGSVILKANTFEATNAFFGTAIFGFGRAGDVSIDADTILISASDVGSQSQSFGGGNSGRVTVTTDALTVTNGGTISSFTAPDSFGNAGNVSVTSTDSITLDGFRPGEVLGFFVPSGIFSSIDGGATGDSGTITINTERLFLNNGAQVRASSLGNGNGGEINIQASESVVINGAVYDAFVDTTYPSAIVSEVVLGGTGRAGNVNITTQNLSGQNGGVISVSTDSSENAGSININASESVIFDGVTTFDEPTLSEEVAVRESGLRSEARSNATGNGGSIGVTTPNFSVINGATLEATTAGAGNAGSMKLNVSGPVLVAGEGSAILANTTSGSTGNGGSIVIDPTQIAVLDGAQISVASEGSGQAGSLFIQGGTLILDRGLISAETVSSSGGNITLNLSDIVVLLNNSRISTTAGTALAGGDGGNIDLTTTYLIAQPNGNNDITANAFSGAGGSVLITAQGIFGLTPRSRAELETLLGTSDPALLDPASLSTSDITAISRGNPALQGQVIIQSPDIDPSQGAVPLPDNVVDASRLIAQGCSSGGAVAQEIGSLVVTGRGGLPPSPTDSLGSSQVLVEWAGVDAGETGAISVTNSSQPRQLAEVQSLVRDSNGQVALVAAATPPQLPTMTCAGVIGGEQP